MTNLTTLPHIAASDIGETHGTLLANTKRYEGGTRVIKRAEHKALRIRLNHDNVCVDLHGNTIVQYRPEGMSISLCGWPTKITLKYINLLTPDYVQVFKRKGAVSLRGAVLIAAPNPEGNADSETGSVYLTPQAVLSSAEYMLDNEETYTLDRKFHWSGVFGAVKGINPEVPLAELNVEQTVGNPYGRDLDIL